MAETKVARRIAVDPELLDALSKAESADEMVVLVPLGDAAKGETSAVVVKVHALIGGQFKLGGRS